MAFLNGNEGGIRILKTSTIIVLVVSIVFATLFIGGFLVLLLIVPPTLSMEKTERDFIENQDNIVMVTKYLEGLEYETLYIAVGENSTMFANLDGYIAIDDPRIVNAINTLRQNGYRKILKRNNTISFDRSAPTLDFSSGVAYTMDENDPQLQFLTRFEPLSEPNWYYCEEDFNLWRERHDTSQ